MKLIEREEGELLGYIDEEKDTWIANPFVKKWTHREMAGGSQPARSELHRQMVDQIIAYLRPCEPIS